jgi:hypothetical protein
MITVTDEKSSMIWHYDVDTLGTSYNEDYSCRVKGTSLDWCEITEVSKHKGYENTHTTERDLTWTMQMVTVVNGTEVGGSSRRGIVTVLLPGSGGLSGTSSFVVWQSV